MQIGNLSLHCSTKQTPSIVTVRALLARRLVQKSWPFFYWKEETIRVAETRRLKDERQRARQEKEDAEDGDDEGEDDDDESLC